MLFRQITDEKLAQYAYLIGCQATGEALIIDPQRDIDRYFHAAEREGLTITAAADTHIHADYLSGLREFAERGVQVFASDEGGDNWRYEWLLDSKYPHRLVSDGDTFNVGNIQFQVVHTPGHTPEHISFLVTDLGGGADEPMGIVTGDFVFVGDMGRPDLLESAAGMEGAMEPSARTLYRSLERFLKLEDYLQVWPAHGAGSACGKALGAVPESTVGYEKRFNGAIQVARSGEDAFVNAILEGQPEPPMYFSRMKRQNRSGPIVLGELPHPRNLRVQDLKGLSGNQSVAVVDTRADRTGFMAAHLPSSIHAPLNKAFNTIVGSYVEESTPIFLIVEEDRVEEAVRDLVRIGLDEIQGYATPDTLENWFEAEGTSSSIEVVSIDHLDEIRSRDDVQVLDVRRASEFSEGHVPGAINISHTRLWVRRDEIPNGGITAVHCKSGGRAATAVSLLQRLGHDVVLVNGPIESWIAKGDAVTPANDSVPA